MKKLFIISLIAFSSTAIAQKLAFKDPYKEHETYVPCSECLSNDNWNNGTGVNSNNKVAKNLNMPNNTNSNKLGSGILGQAKSSSKTLVTTLLTISGGIILTAILVKTSTLTNAISVQH